MAKFTAILVEDEPSSADATAGALTTAGFDVIVYNDAVSALGHSGLVDEMVDLLVLDRRLPMRHGDQPADEVGDELLTAMLDRHADLVSIVFSGHTGFEHLQFATAERGTVSLADGDEVLDRVRLFEKGQSLEFDKYVARIHRVLTELDDIQVTVADGETLSRRDLRIVRRVARELRGASVAARRLSGGLTGSPVWICRIDGENFPTAQVVAKAQVKAREPGGFQTLCPAQLTAGTISSIRGFCAGYFVTIQQLVGDEPVALLDLLGVDPGRAGRVASTLRAGLDTMQSGQDVNIRIDQIAEPLERWDTVVARAADFGIDVPPGSKIATTVRSAQHGDLHPGNVLVAGEHPVVIDFDSQTTASELVDVVALLLGAMFHRESPLRNHQWPTPAQCADLLGNNFLDGCPAHDYFAEMFDWLSQRRRSPRELYAVILAFTVRQLRYPDVVGDALVRGRALALAKWACAQLEAT